MQSKTIYRILAVVLVLAAIYYLFFTGPGTEEKSEPQMTDIEQPSQDSLLTAQPIEEPPVQQTKKERPKPKPRRIEFEGDSEFEEYVVSEGETLQDIALNIYGDSHKWYRLFAINESRIDDWNLIRPGQKLLVPKSE